MATRRAKHPKTGEIVDAVVVEIDEISDRPVKIILDDGSTLRLKTDVIEVVRFEGSWDEEGNPLYSVKSASFMTVLESSEQLKQRPAGIGGKSDA